MHVLRRILNYLGLGLRRLYFSQAEYLTGNYRRFLRGDTLLLIAAALIGMVSGLIIIAFNWCVEYAGDKFDGLFALASSMEWWQYALFPFIPALGGLAVGLMQHYVFRTQPGHGVPEVILAARFGRGRIRRRVILHKMLGAAFSIGSGGGGGREGPIVHVGAAVASAFTDLFRLSKTRGRMLIACGASAGISGIFNAPIGGVLFALEAILGDFRIRTFTPIIVSSVAATAITRSYYGNVSLLHAPINPSIELYEFFMFIILGVLIGFLAVFFLKATIAVERFCEKYLPPSNVLRPAAGGFLAGILIMFFPILMEQTYAPINSALYSELPVWLLLIAALLKPIHMSLTLGSGGTGGAFAPALKSGAMFGSAFGLICYQLFPGLVSAPSTYALAGMGGLLAATLHAPLTGIFILIEITNDYRIILPAMLTAVIATIISQRFCKSSIYSYYLHRSGMELGSYVYLPSASTVTIREILQPVKETIPMDMPISQVLTLFENSNAEAHVVVTKEGKYAGIVEFEDVRSVLTATEMHETLVAADIMITPVKTVTPDTSLEAVLKIFDEYGWRALPVFESGDKENIRYIVTNIDAQKYYRQVVTPQA
ncbi:MAG: chloride channel protein [Chlorobi bacterium]|nr:chloride channel protein [Chlorobiota bacterium]